MPSWPELFLESLPDSPTKSLLESSKFRVVCQVPARVVRRPCQGRRAKLFFGSRTWSLFNSSFFWECQSRPSSHQIRPPSPESCQSRSSSPPQSPWVACQAPAPAVLVLRRVCAARGPRAPCRRRGIPLHRPASQPERGEGERWCEGCPPSSMQDVPS